MHHKPTRERGNEKECDKLQFRRADEKAPTAGKVRKSNKMETVLFSLFDLFLKQTSSSVSPQALRKDLPSCTKPTVKSPGIVERTFFSGRPFPGHHLLKKSGAGHVKAGDPATFRLLQQAIESFTVWKLLKTDFCFKCLGMRPFAEAFCRVVFTTIRRG